MHIVEDIVQSLRAKQIRFLWANVKGSVRDTMEVSGLAKKIGLENFFLTTHDAVVYLSAYVKDTQSPSTIFQIVNNNNKKKSMSEGRHHDSKPHLRQLQNARINSDAEQREVLKAIGNKAEAEAEAEEGEDIITIIWTEVIVFGIGERPSSSSSSFLPPDHTSKTQRFWFFLINNIIYN